VAALVAPKTTNCFGKKGGHKGRPYLKGRANNFCEKRAVGVKE
jgi:hypothetical protein